MMLNDVKTIIDNLEDFIELPDGIERLRRAVLALAVSGKLVPQDPTEGTGGELYEEIQKKRQSETSGSKRKKKNSTSEISLEEVPFEAPKTWKWVKLGSVCELVYGKGLDKERRDPNGAHPAYGANGEIARSEYSHCSRGIVVGRKGSAGAVTYINVPFYALDVTYYIPENQFGAFDIHYLKSLLTSLNLPSLASGIKPGLNREAVYKLTIALPPLAEQKRIVAKVEKVMKQLDALEAKKQERDEVRKRLTRSAMHSLGLGDTKVALQNLQELVKTPNDVKELEKSILTLAVSGKLVFQDSGDTSVEEQLERSDQMRKLVSKSDHRADANPLELLSANERWPIPLSWEWRALADLVLFVDYRGKTPSKTECGVRLITAKNIKKGFISLSPEEFLSEADYPAWMTRGLPQIGDILFTTEAPMGNAAVVSLQDRFALAQRIICFQSYGAIDPNFLVLQLLADPFQAILIREATGITAKGIKASKLKRLPIAIPPLAEQKRIVKKVEELMKLVRALQASLSS